jgi:hypothetical protein
MVMSRIWFTAAQKAELWELWKKGQRSVAIERFRSLALPIEIRAFGEYPISSQRCRPLEPGQPALTFEPPLRGDRHNLKL